MSVTGERLRMLREKSGKSQAEVAKLLGISRPAYVSYETGRSFPSRKIRELSELFGVTTDYLLNQDVNITVTLSDDFKPVSETRKIPIIASVKCGVGGLAFEDYDGYVYIDKKSHGDYIAFRCRGDSMIGENIFADDIAIVSLSEEVESGSIAVVIVDKEEGTLKKYYNDGKAITLVSANPEYPPRVFVGDDMNRVKVVGRVVETRRKR